MKLRHEPIYPNELGHIQNASRVETFLGDSICEEPRYKIQHLQSLIDLDLGQETQHFVPHLMDTISTEIRNRLSRDLGQESREASACSTNACDSSLFGFEKRKDMGEDRVR